MSWAILAIIAPIVFVIYHIISKFLPSGISIFLVNAYAFIFGALLMFMAHFLVSEDKSPYLTSKNLIFALSIGACLSFGNFLIIKAFSLGAPQSSFSAIMYPLLITYSLIAGIFIWHEKINVPQFVGILFAIIGIILIFYFKDSSQLIK